MHITQVLLEEFGTDDVLGMAAFDLIRSFAEEVKVSSICMAIDEILVKVSHEVRQGVQNAFEEALLVLELFCRVFLFSDIN